jgi:hypothetical protein
MLTEMLPFVAVWTWRASSVLKTEVKTGSPSSQALTLKAIQSSRRFESAIDLMVTSGILRSIVVVIRPSLAAEMRK